LRGVAPVVWTRGLPQQRMCKPRGGTFGRSVIKADEQLPLDKLASRMRAGIGPSMRGNCRTSCTFPLVG